VRDAWDVRRRHKYARYYGVGGSFDRMGRPSKHPKQVDVDADFEDHDHELYDLHDDPQELVNLANDRGAAARGARVVRPPAGRRGASSGVGSVGTCRRGGLQRAAVYVEQDQPRSSRR
jgi:hypothetical protein